MNSYTVSGKIVSARTVEFDQNGTASKMLSIKVNVISGQKAKPDDTYPPSMFVEVPVWGNLAKALEAKAVKGNYVVATGNLAVPTTYQNKNGDVNINLSLHSVYDINIIPLVTDSEADDMPTSDSDVTEKTTTSKAKKAKKVESELEDFDEIPF